MIGHAVADLPGTSFVMPEPTAAAVTGYGGSGGAIANGAGADAANDAPNEVAAAVSETTLVAVAPLVDPRQAGAPFQATTTAAPGGAETYIGAPMKGHFETHPAKWHVHTPLCSTFRLHSPPTRTRLAIRSGQCHPVSWTQAPSDWDRIATALSGSGNPAAKEEHAPSVTLPPTLLHAIVWCVDTPVLQSPDDRRERQKREPHLGPMSASQPQRPHQKRATRPATSPRSA